jgi:hypothetical protein
VCPPKAVNMTADIIMLGDYYFPNKIGGAEIQQREE